MTGILAGEKSPSGTHFPSRTFSTALNCSFELLARLKRAGSGEKGRIVSGYRAERNPANIDKSVHYCNTSVRDQPVCGDKQKVFMIRYAVLLL